ncbi:MAG: 4Fe-4S dicluster domain-containing protein, partial [Spirochaetaceae bacterium]|nr:4Fe-4S dicluster domain-containing protein [Spirochaetaceae bacterium]
RHCENPACKQACASDAIRVEGGVVLIDGEKCIGCKNCVIACPFGAVEIVESAEIARDGTKRKTANKCDLCAGAAASPSCVRVCPTAALSLVNESSFDCSLKDKRRSALESSL